MYRKFTADYIFTGNELLSDGNVLITDTTGKIIEIVKTEDAGDQIETFKGLISPGFINAHCHLELSHLKNCIAEKTGLVNFVQQVMQHRNLLSELKQEAMVNAEAEIYKAGIVAVGDICNTADSILIKQKSNIRWHNFVEVSGFADAGAAHRLNEMKIIYNEFKRRIESQKTTFSPHAPYSVSKKLFQLLNDETAHQLTTIHNQESAAENELYQHKRGEFLSLYKNFKIDIAAFNATSSTSLKSWLPYFTKGQSIISVHNTFTSSEDFAFATEQFAGNIDQLFYCLCINANHYIEQKTPPIKLMIENKCQIVIGTDSLASNHQLNILEEIKAIEQATNYTIPLNEILKWATLNGAKALNFDDELGSFEKGKKPGIVLIDGLNNLHCTKNSTAKRLL